MSTPDGPPPAAPEARKHPYALKTVMDLFDVSPVVAILALAGAAVVVALSITYFVRSAPPDVITISTGPEGSVSRRQAERYAKILAKNDVTLKILPSEGSVDNLKRLSTQSPAVDVAFVQSGVSKNAPEGLVSLGSISYQPLMIFYRGKPIELLSQLEGKKIVIGPEGSGVHAVSIAVLAANDFPEAKAARRAQDGPKDERDVAREAREAKEALDAHVKPPKPTTLLDWQADRATKALLAREIDAIFIMGDSTPMPVLRTLLRSPDLHLYDFKQAAAYSRKLDFLHVLEFPQGSIDLGDNIPARDITLVGPTVELIATKRLHPALSDLLLGAAAETHARPGLFQKRGEFPPPQEHTIPISEDARRYYTSGKSLLYRFLPFWLASLLSRLVVAFIPMLVVLIPVLRSIPAFFRWRVKINIRRHYRALLSLEDRYLKEPDSAEREKLRQEFFRIEEKVELKKISPAFADQFYGLRGHIAYVRDLVGKT